MFKSKILIIWVLFCLCCLIVSASSGDCVVVSNYEEQITVDGNLDEWNKSQPVYLNKSCRVLNGKITDDSDLSAVLYCGYNEKYLFFAIEVKDDVFTGPFDSLMAWQNDGIELWFDLAFDSDTTGMVQDDDLQIICSAMSKSGKPLFAVSRNQHDAYIYADSKIASVKTADGYIMEFATPLGGLKGLRQPVKGSVIGFNISLCDNDGKNYSRLLWTGNREGKPLQFGLLSFGKVEDTKIKKCIEEKSLRANKADKQVVLGEYKGFPEIYGFAQNLEEVEKYAKFELTVDILAKYENPFDFEQICLQGHFISPGGVETVVDGFYFQDYSLNLGYAKTDGQKKKGNPQWKVRFTPVEEGDYQFYLTIKDTSGKSSQSSKGVFKSIPSDLKGFIRVSKKDPMYLDFDNGDSFFGIGAASHIWSSTAFDILKFKHYLSQIALFGGNYTSVNLQVRGGGSPFCPETRGTGLGSYSHKNGYKLDYFLEAANKRQMYIIGCVVQNAILRSKHWAGSQYNIANGGPCKSPEDYFTNPEAIKLQKKRFRYMVARWGYSVNILSFELMNEVNYTDGALKNPESVRKWHRDMAAYLKKIDVNKHLVTTSFGSADRIEDDQIWMQSGIDHIITHAYSRDIVGEIHPRLLRKIQFKKPNLGGECGMTYPQVNEAASLDRAGVAFHNTIWGSAFSHSAGTILSWWQHRYHDSLDLYEHMRAFSKFANGIKWSQCNFRSVDLQAFKANAEGFKDVVLPAKPEWNKPVPPNRRMKYTNIFSIRGNKIWQMTQTNIDYKTAGPEIIDTAKRVINKDIPAIVFPAKHKQSRGVLELILYCSNTTRVAVPVNAVSTEGAVLEISKDGELKYSLELSDKDGDDNPYAKEIGIVKIIELTKGRHVVKIENKGDGWAVLGDIKLGDYINAKETEAVRIFGLQGEDLTVLWFQNTENTWYLRTLEDKKPLIEIDDVYAELKDVKAGSYTIQWWDTYKGKVFKTEKLESKGTVLKIAVPAFKTDVACKIIHEI